MEWREGWEREFTEDQRNLAGLSYQQYRLVFECLRINEKRGPEFNPREARERMEGEKRTLTILVDSASSLFPRLSGEPILEMASRTGYDCGFDEDPTRIKLWYERFGEVPEPRLLVLARREFGLGGEELRFLRLGVHEWEKLTGK